MKHKEEILRLKQQGKSYNEIASILGCSKGTIAYHLGTGQKEKTRNRQRETRSEIKKYIQEYKQNKICADCKENYPYWIMEFDHLSDKKFNISAWKTFTQNIEIIKIEIEKCEVVCSNCHRNRTYQRERKSYTETTSSMDVSMFYPE